MPERREGFVLQFWMMLLPFLTKSVKLALINSYSITVHQLSDLVCQHFFKFELEFQLLASHLFFSED